METNKQETVGEASKSVLGFYEDSEWQSKMTEAFKNDLNRQRASNAEYESKISELENKIKIMFSEEDIKNAVLFGIHIPRDNKDLLRSGYSNEKISEIYLERLKNKI